MYRFRDSATRWSHSYYETMSGYEKFAFKLVGNNQSYVYLEFSLRMTALMKFRHDDWYVIFI